MSGAVAGLSGETIDYGPCAFLDVYDPNRTFSSIDRWGRYAFSNQPRIAQWNLACFAETLFDLLSGDKDEATRLVTEQLKRFTSRFEINYARVMRAKLGFAREEDNDLTLVEDLFALETLVRVLEKPYDDQPDFSYLAEPPGTEQRFYRTFCGT